MTPENLGSWIPEGENLAVEFKGEEPSPLDDRDLLEAVVCRANRSGIRPSCPFIGIEDDGRITGARQRHAPTTNPDKLAALIAGRTRPALSVHVENSNRGGRALLVIQIPPQRKPVATSEGVFLRRTIGGDGRPACLPMDGYAMQSLEAGRGLLDSSYRSLARLAGKIWTHWSSSVIGAVSVDEMAAVTNPCSMCPTSNSPKPWVWWRNGRGVAHRKGTK